ncbi:MAG: hypothetical protein AB7U85_00540 [Alphaproteobacteria bacterium]
MLKKKFYAFVDNVDILSKSSKGRVYIEFDCINAEAYKIGNFNSKPDAYAVLRIVTTKKRLLDITSEKTLPKTSSWWEIGVSSNKKWLPTWFSKLQEDGFSFPIKCYTHGLKRIKDDEDYPKRKSLSAAATKKVMLSDVTQDFCIDNLSREKCNACKILSKIKPIDKIIIYDVGQANFIALLNKDNQKELYVDVGFPLPFNYNTINKAITAKVSKLPQATILLTHWDYDHMSAVFKNNNLRESNWVVPNQKIGPSKFKLAKELADRGKLHIWDNSNSNCRKYFNFGDIKLATGDDINNSGLILNVRFKDFYNVLMSGDTDYSNCPFNLTFDAIVATHHGGSFNGRCPSPKGGLGIKHNFIDKVYLSYGKGNRYKHPSNAATNQYIRNGWKIERTAKDVSKKRGDISIS